MANRAKSNPSWNRANRKKHDASIFCLGIFINRVESSFLLQHDVRSLEECWGEFTICTNWICMNFSLRLKLKSLRYIIDLVLKCFERYSSVMTHYMNVWLSFMMSNFRPFYAILYYWAAQDISFSPQSDLIAYRHETSFPHRHQIRLATYLRTDTTKNKLLSNWISLIRECMSIVEIRLLTKLS